MENKRKFFSIVNNVNELPKLTEIAENIVADWQLPMTFEMTINLVLEEVVSNIIFYAYKDTLPHLLSLEVLLFETYLCLRIIDDGIPFDPTKKEPADISLSTEEREIGGLGILLVHQLMDTVRYQRDKNKNILTLTKIIKS